MYYTCNKSKTQVASNKAKVMWVSRGAPHNVWVWIFRFSFFVFFFANRRGEGYSLVRHTSADRQRVVGKDKESQTDNIE